MHDVQLADAATRFLLVGPPGTGKTFIASLLAEALHGNDPATGKLQPGALLKYDMQDFTSEESVKKLLGPEPGLVGDCSLCDGLQANPRAVVLFDEIEKAHPKVSLSPSLPLSLSPLSLSFSSLFALLN